MTLPFCLSYFVKWPLQFLGVTLLHSSVSNYETTWLHRETLLSLLPMTATLFSLHGPFVQYWKHSQCFILILFFLLASTLNFHFTLTRILKIRNFFLTVYLQLLFLLLILISALEWLLFLVQSKETTFARYLKPGSNVNIRALLCI